MKKRLISTVLAFVMCFSLTATTFAEAFTSTEISTSDSLAAFDQYVIIMNRTNMDAVNASVQKSNAVTKDIAYRTSYDSAIAYVKSLNLKNVGHEYIEQACLEELNVYKEAGIELNYYAVLVPNGTASTEYTYGTYNGRTFYYTYTSIVDFNITKNGGSLDSASLKKWVEGTFNLILGFACQEYSILYSLFDSVGSSATYSTGSSFQYIFQFYNVKSRTIYTYSGSAKKNVLVDQYGTSNLTTLFIPIGATPSNLTSTWTGRVSRTTYYNNKDRNLQRAYVNYTHNSSESWYLSTEVLSEVWR